MDQPDDSALAEAAILPFIDHLVFATPDLQSTIESVENRVGVRACFGGQHLGAGTRNALICMGPQQTLEILAPDPAQPEPPRARPFGLDRLKAPRLAAWFASGRDLLALRAKAIAAGVPLGEVISWSRRRPDGVEISWEFTDPWVTVASGIVPPFVDWMGAPHPADTAPGGVELIGLRAEHPSPQSVQAMLRHLDLPLQVNAGAEPALIARLRTPRGLVELR